MHVLHHVARHLTIFGWLLKAGLREENCEDVVHATLPPLDAKFVMAQRKKPVAVITRIRQIVADLAERNLLQNAPHRAIEGNLLELNKVYGMCERLKSSPIPPLYTSHTSRLLVFYLFYLPVALNGMHIMKPPGVVLATAAIGFAMFGLDEISHQLEQPFRIIPLQQLSAGLMRDVADTVVCPPPSISGHAFDNIDHKSKSATPSYW